MNECMCIESPAHGTCSMDVTVTTPTATAVALELITASKYKHESSFALCESSLRPEEAVERAVVIAHGWDQDASCAGPAPPGYREVPFQSLGRPRSSRGPP